MKSQDSGLEKEQVDLPILIRTLSKGCSRSSCQDVSPVTTTTTLEAKQCLENNHYYSLQVNHDWCREDIYIHPPHIFVQCLSCILQSSLSEIIRKCRQRHAKKSSRVVSTPFVHVSSLHSHTSTFSSLCLRFSTSSIMRDIFWSISFILSSISFLSVWRTLI
jgi:hypothetical protein